MRKKRETSTLSLDLDLESKIWIGQVKLLKEWCQETAVFSLNVSSYIRASDLSPKMTHLGAFKNLQVIDLKFTTSYSAIHQGYLSACALLPHLKRISLSGGFLSLESLDFSVLSVLNRLTQLSVLPIFDALRDGLDDDDVISISELRNLEKLKIRGSATHLTDRGIESLSILGNLKKLCILPLGSNVTKEGLIALLHPLTPCTPYKEGKAVSSSSPPADVGLATTTGGTLARRLETLWVGVTNSRQIPGLAVLEEIPNLKITIRDPDLDQLRFFPLCTLVLRTSLVSLSLGTFATADAAFLTALGTLTRLRRLTCRVALEEGGRPFTCNLALLAPLRHLRDLEFVLASCRIVMPLTPEVVSKLGAGFGMTLESLSLSCTTKADLAAGTIEALAKAFPVLRKLSLFAPLDYERSPEAMPLLSPVVFTALPDTLTHLSLECADLRWAKGAESIADSGFGSESGLGSSCNSSKLPEGSGLNDSPHSSKRGGVLLSDESLFPVSSNAGVADDITLRPWSIVNHHSTATARGRQKPYPSWHRIRRPSEECLTFKGPLAKGEERSTEPPSPSSSPPPASPSPSRTKHDSGKGKGGGGDVKEENVKSNGVTAAAQEEGEKEEKEGKEKEGKDEVKGGKGIGGENEIRGNGGGILNDEDRSEGDDWDREDRGGSCPSDALSLVRSEESFVAVTHVLLSRTSRGGEAQEVEGPNLSSVDARTSVSALSATELESGVGSTESGAPTPAMSADLDAETANVRIPLTDSDSVEDGDRSVKLERSAERASGDSAYGSPSGYGTRRNVSQDSMDTSMSSVCRVSSVSSVSSVTCTLPSRGDLDAPSMTPLTMTPLTMTPLTTAPAASIDNHHRVTTIANGTDMSNKPPVNLRSTGAVDTEVFVISSRSRGRNAARGSGPTALDPAKASSDPVLAHPESAVTSASKTRVEKAPSASARDGKGTVTDEGEISKRKEEINDFQDRDWSCGLPSTPSCSEGTPAGRGPITIVGGNGGIAGGPRIHSDSSSSSSSPPPPSDYGRGSGSKKWQSGRRSDVEVDVVKSDAGSSEEAALRVFRSGQPKEALDATESSIKTTTLSAERAQQPRRATKILSNLTFLELSDCACADDVLAAVLAHATGLEHVDLTAVRGLSGTGAAFRLLSRLPRLSRLSVSLPDIDCPSNEPLANLASCASLRILDWSAGRVWNRIQLEQWGYAAIGRWRGLRHLHLEVELSELERFRKRVAEMLPGCVVDTAGCLLVEDPWDEKGSAWQIG